jgi:zinc-ribbon domain
MSGLTEQGFRFCPRCGTELVAGRPYCPNCGFNIADIGGPRPEPDDGDPDAIDSLEQDPDRNPFERRSDRAPIVLGAVIVAAGLIAFGLLMRPGAGVAPTPGSGGTVSTVGPAGASASPVGPSAPIVGLTIQSPQDGQAVATKDVTVVGLAPPGLTVTRDISFGLDQHATADGTGHWAINVGLQEGRNELVFRIGDDRSTEKRLRVTFTPPSAQ